MGLFQVMLYLALFASFVVGAVIFYLWRTADAIGADITLFIKGWRDFDCVAVHTYCPKKDTIRLPLRGRLTIQAAYLLALRANVPILLAVGHTIPGDPRTEGQIYADFLYRNCDFTNVILGEDPDARDTAREAKEMHRLCMVHGFKKVMRFGARYHLARISWHWNRINGWGTRNYFKTIFWYWLHPGSQETLKTYFVGVYVPAYLYFFEVPFFLVDMCLQFADMYLPAKISKVLRDKMLNIINRKG